MYPTANRVLRKVNEADLPSVLPAERSGPDLAAGIGARVASYDASSWIQLIITCRSSSYST